MTILWRRWLILAHHAGSTSDARAAARRRRCF